VEGSRRPPPIGLKPYSAEDAGALRLLEDFKIDAGWRPNQGPNGEQIASDCEFFRNYTISIRSLGQPPQVRRSKS
jgi:hypothetical protein